MAKSSNQYLDEYNKLFEKTNQMIGDQGKFEKTLKEGLLEKQNFNKDLIEQKGRLTSDLISLPGQLRQSFYSGAIRDPLAQEAIIGGRTGNIAGSYGNVVDLLNTRGMRFSDILNSAKEQYSSEVGSAERAAENAWRMYQDAQAREKQSRGSGVDLSDYFGTDEGAQGLTGSGVRPPAIVPEGYDKSGNWIGRAKTSGDPSFYSKKMQKGALGLLAAVNPALLWSVPGVRRKVLSEGKSMFSKLLRKKK